MIWLVVVLGVLVIGLSFFLIYQLGKNEDNKVKIEYLNSLYEEQMILVSQKSKENKKISELQRVTSEKVNTLQNELIQLQNSIQVEAVKNDSKESLEAELEILKALAAQKLLELERISANTKQLTELQE